jgi:hypothetical protein
VLSPEPVNASTVVSSAVTLAPPSVLYCGSVPALEVLYSLNSGAEIVGTLEYVRGLLLTSLCSVGLSSCPAYDTQMIALWRSYAAAVCGYPAGGDAALQGAGTSAAVELLLSQCGATFAGNLTQVTLAVAVQFTTVSTRSRTDVSTVISFNALLTGPNASGSLATLDPPIIPRLAPVPALGREPAAVTAQPPPVLSEYVPSNPTLLSAELAGGSLGPPYLPSQLPLAQPAVFPALTQADATTQSPAALASAALTAGPAGVAFYSSRWLAHPSPLADYDPSYCVSRQWDDAACYPPLLPLIGVTHDAYGNRLLSDRGGAVPAGTPDAAGVSTTSGQVPLNAFVASTPYVLANK